MFLLLFLCFEGVKQLLLEKNCTAESIFPFFLSLFFFVKQKCVVKGDSFFEGFGAFH